MCDPADAFEPEDTAAKERVITKARAQIAAGKGVPHERVAAWLRDLSNGIRRPQPK